MLFDLLVFFLYVSSTNEKKYRSYDNNITYYLGFNNNNNYTKQIYSNYIIDTPSRFDWRDKVNVPIRNQGQCGSCWAFATVSPLEYQYTYKTNKPLHISEQNLVSCNTHKYSCEKGGWWDFDDLMKNGIVLDDSYSYDGKDELCKKIEPVNYIKVINWGNIDNNIESIKSAIFQYGPIVSGVSVDKEFYNYVDGIYDHNSDEDINHAVVIVGWDDNLHSWILRNSWGTKWGSNGYMYIEYEVSGIGSISAYVIVDINDNYIS